MCSNDEKRVLHVVHSLGMGGAETWLVQIIRHWNRTKGVFPKIDFLITGGKTSVFDEEVSAMGSNLFYVELNKRNVFIFIRGIRKILRDNKYVAIHDHQDFLSGWHFFFGAGLLPNIRIAHVHNPSYQIRENYGTSVKRRIQSRVGKLLLKKYATHIGGTSKQLLTEYDISPKKFPNQWVGAIHCAFPISDWQGNHIDMKISICDELGWPGDCKLVLFAGRLDYSLDINHPQNHKNSVFALNIIEKCNNGDDIRMIMAGANNYIMQEFQQLIDRKGLTKFIKVVGIRKDMQRLMLGSDMLLFPSRGEGLGMVAVEAQASGLPVLASTAVPKECIVIGELVHFCDLKEPISEWNKELNLILSKPRPLPTGFDERWEKSMFNIDLCSDYLVTLYKQKVNQ